MPDLQEIQQLLNRIGEIRANATTRERAAFQLFSQNGNALLQQVYQIRKESETRSQTRSSRYCLFDQVQLTEPQHSRFLANLLDAKGNHGQGSKFLYLFLKEIKYPESFEGIWEVTVETGRVDITLRRRDAFGLVLIENKAMGAMDQEHQLFRYAERLAPDWIEVLTGVKPQYQENVPIRIVYMPIWYSMPSQHSITSSVNPKIRLSNDYIKVFPFKNDVIRLFQKYQGVVDQDNHRLQSLFEQYIHYWNN